MLFTHPIAAFSSLDRIRVAAQCREAGCGVKLYRINKVAKRSGEVLKHRDVLAGSDREAVQRARESEDCPVCDVLRDGKPIGSII